MGYYLKVPRDIQKITTKSPSVVLSGKKELLFCGDG